MSSSSWSRWSVCVLVVLASSCTYSLAGPPAPRRDMRADGPRRGHGIDVASPLEDKHAPTDAPTDVIGLAGEYEPVDRVLLGWHGGNWEYVSFFASVLRAIQPDARALIAVESETDELLLRETLSAEGVDPSRVDYVIHELNSMWIRDYGPVVVRTRAGGLRVIDLPYHPDREGDDGYPERFASLENLPLSRPPLEMEGGHIQSDGVGNCIVTDDVLYMNAEHAYDEEDLLQILGAYFGCRVLSFVPALVGEETGHVDVFAYVTGPRQVLVGAYALEDDAVNARRLNHAAGILRDAGWTVTRIRMPGNARRRVFRTHTNVVVTDRTVLVPVFRADRRFERAALRAFARAFPGRRVVPIPADDVMDLAGALHCTVIALPRRARG